MKTTPAPDLGEMTRREIEDYLVERAIVDSGFRSRLLNEPAPLLRELGLAVGKEVSIKVLEEEPKSFYIVLPRILREMEELDNEELDHVDGGVGESTGARKFFSGYF